MDGILIINKPRNITSRDVINILNQRLETKQIGHAGTLDPIATGVLIVGVGKGTKVINEIANADKEYQAKFKLGIQTDTFDITGKVINQTDKLITKKKLEQVIKEWPKEYEQTVPHYSAIKINGQRAYDLARHDVNFETPKRLVQIKKLELLNHENNEAEIKCLVSKGTYIRSLIDDIGLKLGTYATMTELVRTKQGQFGLDKALELDQVTINDLIPLEEVIKDPIMVNEELYNKIKYGQILDNNYNKEKIYFVYQDKLVAIYELYKKDESKIKPVHVFIKED